MGVTDYGRAQLAAMDSGQRQDEPNCRFTTRRALELNDLLRDSYNIPIQHLQNITPDWYMEYIFQMRGRNKQYLSISSCDNKCSALYHLFLLHNRMGFLPDFDNHLSNLFCGFNRDVVSSQQTQHIVYNEDDIGEEGAVRAIDLVNYHL